MPLDTRGYVAAGQRSFEQEPKVELRHAGDHPSHTPQQSAVVLDDGQVVTVVEKLPIAFQLFQISDAGLMTVAPAALGASGTAGVIPVFDDDATFRESGISVVDDGDLGMNGGSVVGVDLVDGRDVSVDGATLDALDAAFLAHIADDERHIDVDWSGVSDDQILRYNQANGQFEAEDLPAADPTFPTFGGDEIQFRSGTGGTLAGSSFATVDAAAGIGLGQLSALLLQPQAFAIEMTGTKSGIKFDSVSPTVENGAMWFNSTSGFLGGFSGGTVRLIRRKAFTSHTSIAVTNDATLTTVFTTTINGAIYLWNNDGVRFLIPGRYLNNTGVNQNLLIRISFGATVLWQDTITIGAAGVWRPFWLDMHLCSVNASNNEVLTGLLGIGSTSAPTTGEGGFRSTGAVVTPIRGVAALNRALSTALKVEIQHGAASANLSFEAYGHWGAHTGENG